MSETRKGCRQAWVEPHQLRGAGDGPVPGFVSTLTEDVSTFALRRWDGTPPMASGSVVHIVERRPYGGLLVEEFSMEQQQVLYGFVEWLRSSGRPHMVADRFPKRWSEGVTWA